MKAREPCAGRSEEPLAPLVRLPAQCAVQRNAGNVVEDEHAVDRGERSGDRRVLVLGHRAIECIGIAELARCPLDRIYAWIAADLLDEDALIAAAADGEARVRI